MTYFGVLASFVLPPLLFLLGLAIFQGKLRREEFLAVFGHVLIALIYTTPWDNYLVATGVWWYDPNLVSGITIGWVPLEEYAFFVLQTMLTGFWVLQMRRFIPGPAAARAQVRPAIRWGLTSGAAALWLVSTVGLFAGLQPLTYLTLILFWALIPVMIQLAVGGDVLLENWRCWLAGLLPPTLYLWVADALAIKSGTWTIDPQQTTGLMLASLPVEEMLFFFMTNLLIVNGMVLIGSAVIRERVKLGWMNLMVRSAD
jgi:lycopene cyclase domain-containing protein